MISGEVAADMSKPNQEATTQTKTTEKPVENNGQVRCLMYIFL